MQYDELIYIIYDFDDFNHIEPESFDEELYWLHRGADFARNLEINHLEHSQIWYLLKISMWIDDFNRNLYGFNQNV